MKTLEIYIDESGDITRSRPMNISGVAVLAPGEEARDAFHASYFERLASAGLTAGVCDLAAANTADARQIAETLEAPERFIPKRPGDGDWDAFWATIHRTAHVAQACADEHGVDLLAFSLRFPASTTRRWGTADPAVDLLLDRPYGECLKDVLELLLFETPRIRQAIASGPGCLLAFDLPTRTLAAPVEEPDLDAKVAEAWGRWGVQARDDFNRETGHPELVANTLEPADGIEILTAALNRRTTDSIPFRVERARCCKLVSWSQWAMPLVPDPIKRQKKRYWAMASSPRPRQIHFLADFLSNGIFNDNIRPSMDPYRIWFDRGFVLSSVDEGADVWLSAVRSFANGDRVGALQAIREVSATPGHERTKTYHFFRRAATGWPARLTGAELKRLFAVA